MTQPQTSVAAPQPQGTICSGKLRVFILSHDLNHLRSKINECMRLGHAVIGAIIQAPHTTIPFTDNAIPSVRTPAEAQELLNKVNPDVIISTGIKTCGFNVGEDLRAFGELVNTEIPAVFPDKIPNIIDTASGLLIHRQDGKEGQSIQDRHINLGNFLKETAAKLNAQGTSRV